MPKKLLATTITIVLAITMLTSVSMVTANYIPTQPKIQIYSPSQPYIRTYNTTSITLSFDVKMPADAPHHYPEVNSIYYSLDGQPAIEINNVEKFERVSWFSGICEKYKANVVLENLAVGDHNVTVFCKDSIGRQLSDARDFTVSALSVSNSPTLNEVTPSVANHGTEDRVGFNLTLAAITIMILLVGVAFISLVYFKRRKDKP
jgi:hypothetical protein